MKKINACRIIEINWIIKGAEFKKSDIVLDIGSGDGYWTNYFSKKCSKITGIEPYKEHLTIAEKNYSANCNFIEGSAEDLKFNSNSFDKVISVCVFEHLFNDELAFSEIYRVLKTKGRLSATIDSLNSKHISEDYKKKHIKECYCAQLYTVDSIKKKLTSAGFKDIEANYIIGSGISIFYEKLSESIGAISYFLLLPLFPVIMVLEKNYKTSGYKIFVSAEK
jgi:ubiquinone/menaquinone biosynthesis C-methylase UbiE